MLFILDPDPDFLPIPDPGVKTASDPGSGSVTLMAGQLVTKQKGGKFKVLRVAGQGILLAGIQSSHTCSRVNCPSLASPSPELRRQTPPSTPFRSQVHYYTCCGSGSERIQNFWLVFRIRIHLIRIRIQHYRLNYDPNPIRIQDLMTKS